MKNAIDGNVTSNYDPSIIEEKRSQEFEDVVDGKVRSNNGTEEKRCHPSHYLKTANKEQEVEKDVGPIKSAVTKLDTYFKFMIDGNIRPYTPG